MSLVARSLIALAMLFLLLIGGTAGYFWLEGWSLSESLYMTVITITTVGFAEVRPLSTEGRHFTIVFLILSIATVGYSVTVLISFLFEGEIFKAVRDRRMRRSIRRLKNHFILCGGGDVAREIAQEFKKAKVRFIVVDIDVEQSELARDESVLLLEGDATDDEVLEKAGIENARGLLAVLPADESNVFVTLSARQLNPGLTIVAQANDERSFSKLMKAGANRVISPKQIAGRRMAYIVLRPSVVNFLDIIMEGDGLAMRIEEVAVRPETPLVKKTLREMEIGQHTGAMIVAIVDALGRTRVNPSETATLSTISLNEGDVLVALGNEQQLSRLRSFVSGKA